MFDWLFGDYGGNDPVPATAELIRQQEVLMTNAANSMARAAVKPFDPTKPFTTRDGRKVRELRRLETPLMNGDVFVGVMTSKDGTRDNVVSWRENGMFSKYGGNSLAPTDLINVPDKRKVKRWFNVYEDGRAYGCYETKKRADDYAGTNRIACVEREIEFEVGEGL